MYGSDPSSRREGGSHRHNVCEYRLKILYQPDRIMVELVSCGAFQ